MSRSSAVNYPTPSKPTPLRTIYVHATDGDDSRTLAQAQNSATPWKTIDKIEANAQAGDRFILTGTFNAAQGSGPLQVATSGTADNPIQIVASSPGGAVLAMGTASLPTIWLSSMDYWWFEDFEIQRAAWADTWDGVLWVAGCNNHTFVRCEFQSCSVHVLGAGSTDNRFYDCTAFGTIGTEAENNGDWIFIQNGAHRTKVVRFDCSTGTAWHSCITISFQGAAEDTADDCIIAGCNVSNTAAGAGIIINGKAVRAIVEDNRIHHCSDTYSGVTQTPGSRLGLELEGTDCIARYNRIWTCYKQGISLQSRSDFASFLAPCTGNHVHNNTIYDCGGIPIEIIGRNADGDPRNNVIENNLGWGNHTLGTGTEESGYFSGNYYSIWANFANTLGNDGAWSTSDSHGNIIRNNFLSRTAAEHRFLLVVRLAGDGGNLTHTLAQAEAAYSGWADNIASGDPLLLDPANGNFSLRAGSPCIGVAFATVGVSGNDIGALEATVIAFDAFSQTSAVDFSATWNHIPVGTPRGVIVFVKIPNNGNDVVTSVTYGGVAATRVAASRKTTGEAMGCYAYFLGSGIPTGTQSIVVTCSAGSVIHTGAISVTNSLDTGTRVVASDATINSDSIADPSVTLGLGGEECFAAVGFVSGQDAATGVAPLADWTSRQEGELASMTSGVYNYDVVGSLDVTAGWTQTAEDAVAVAVAIADDPATTTVSWAHALIARAVGASPVVVNNPNTIVEPGATEET